MFSYPNLDTSLLAQENATQNQTLVHGFHPNFEHDGFDELLLAIQLLPNKSPSLPPPEPTLMTPNSEANIIVNKGRKRTVRRDRHSKIITAKGPRDRRMRLSLKVAKKFFDLQDVLGFDKASKTVEWLLNMSKDAIKTITNCGSRSEHRASCSGTNAKIESSTTECEVDSATPVNNTKEAEVLLEVVAGGVRVNKTKARKPRAPRKALCDPMTAKELRAKARVRAKERTRGKRMWMSTMSEDNNLPKQFQPNVEELNYYINGVAAMEGTTNDGSTTMGHQHGGLISTYGYDHGGGNHNMYPPPLGAPLDHWYVNSSTFGGQKGSLDAHLLTKAWEGFNSW